MTPETTNQSDSAKASSLAEKNSDKIDNIKDELKSLKNDVDECQDMKGKMDTLDERTKTILAKSTRNENAIFGNNGTPGMKDRLTSVEGKLDEVKEDVGSFKKIGYAIIIAVLGIFLELLVQLFLIHGAEIIK